MGIVFQKDKRSGIEYAYDNVSYWDKEKKQSRSKRSLIGRVNEAGEIVPTDGRCRRDKNNLKRTRKRGPVPITQIKRVFYGATYLFDEIVEKIGLSNDLRVCFPSDYKAILSMAYYLMLGENRAMMNFNYWAREHIHPHEADISSQESSRILAQISDEQVRHFIELQWKRRSEDEYWAYDSTSISSYSTTIKQVKYGKNKESDPLPQINILLLYGEKTGLPFYYRKLSGNIPDVKTVNTLVKELDTIGKGKAKFVMDRGFYSKKNIDQLFQYHHKFIVAASTRLSFVKKRIDELGEKIRDYEKHDPVYGLGVSSTTIEWDYAQERPYKKDILTDKRRMYLHLYYNVQKAADDELALNDKIDKLKEELVSGNTVDSHEKMYQRYFTIRKTRGGQTIKVNEEAIREEKLDHGYFSLISNEIKDPIIALCLYRSKDVVEKAFCNIKERLNCRRFLTSSEASLNGKLFVVFVGLIILSYIHTKMQKNGLYRTYTLEQVLLELDGIEGFIEPGRAPIIGEILERQRKLYNVFDVTPPQ